MISYINRYATNPVMYTLSRDYLNGQSGDDRKFLLHYVFVVIHSVLIERLFLLLG